MKNQPANPYPPDSMLHRAYNYAISNQDPQEFINSLSDVEINTLVDEFSIEWEKVCKFINLLTESLETVKTIGDLKTIAPIANIFD